MKENTKKGLLELMILLAMLTAVLLAGWQDSQRENMGDEEKESDNTVLFVCGFPSIDAWMDFSDNEITEEEDVSDVAQTAQHSQTAENGSTADTLQTAQQDTQHDQAGRNEYFSDVPQCLWGKWVVTEKWVNNIYGWDANAEDELLGTSIELLPDSFGFGSESDEKMYYAHVMAVEDPWKWYEDTGIYWELGIRGDYYFVFSFGSGSALRYTGYWMLASENEIVIPFTRYLAYKLEKAESYDVEEEDCSFEIDRISCYDICYGEWKAVNVVRTNGTLDLAACMEKRLVIRKREDMDLTWRVLGRSNEAVDRFARRIGLGENNEYLICYDLPKDCFWEQMILIDDMTAILTKGDNLFLAERISDPEEDHIYRTLP